MFSALVLNQHDQQTLATIQAIDDEQLPMGNVLVKVNYSSLNYKDALAITGKGKIIRQFPMIPGIDFCGEVLESGDGRYQKGDPVLLTGWGVGENHWGGMAQKARVNADWLVPLPAELSQAQAMFLGTAGFTAMLCVQALQSRGILPEQGEVLVTGASGGVGSVAVALLAALGYQVVAVTGRTQNSDYLQQQGAARVLDRDTFVEPGKPLEQQCWAGAIDTVGGTVLARVLSQIQYGGAVAACGLAGGYQLATTVMPFILRNVALLGIDSVQCPFEKRLAAWQQLAQLIPDSFYQHSGQTIELAQVSEYANRLLTGQVTGRTLIRL